MKIKQYPDDFYVEELTDVFPTGEGSYGLYRLEKCGWSTPDAVSSICRRWQLAAHRVSFGGLKDRHARTVQYLTIHHGPRRGLKHHTVKLEYLGQVNAPYTSHDIRANGFRLAIRDLNPATLSAMEQALEEIRNAGVPNYFDDQRFGSVAKGGEFIARLLVQGRYEEALQLALTAPYQHDPSVQKKEKAILRAHWGDWTVCKERLRNGHACGLVGYLASHPGDFRGALARLRPELRSLYLSVYQSYLWNRMLAKWLQEHCRPEQLLAVKLRLGEVPMHRGLDDSQRQGLSARMVPLPSARMKMDPADPRAVLVHAVLAEEGLELRRLQVKGIRALFFSKGERPALCLPAHLRHEIAPDDRHPGRQQVLLSFELPRGSYATLIVKRITGSEPPSGR